MGEKKELYINDRKGGGLWELGLYKPVFYDQKKKFMIESSVRE